MSAPRSQYPPLDPGGKRYGRVGHHGLTVDPVAESVSVEIGPHHLGHAQFLGLLLQSFAFLPITHDECADPPARAFGHIGYHFKEQVMVLYGHQPTHDANGDLVFRILDIPFGKVRVWRSGPLGNGRGRNPVG